jgi:hypothetical protein
MMTALDKALKDWRLRTQFERDQVLKLLSPPLRLGDVYHDALFLLRAASPETKPCSGFIQGSGETYVHRTPCILPELHGGGPCRFDPVPARCKMCPRPLAYGGAVYCGAACCALDEVRP